MRRRGFTLIEALVTLALLAIAIVIIAGAFRVVTAAWKRGGAAIEELHHGDFVAEQIGVALRSAAYYRSNTGTSLYGFQFEDKSGTYPEDRISWVTTSRAMVSPTSVYARATHRIELSMGEIPGMRESALVARAWSHLARDVRSEDIEPWLVSPRVRGLDCRFWNAEREEFEDEWTNTNRLPERVEIDLYFDPPSGATEPLITRQMIRIPVAGLATSQVNDIERRRR